MILLVNQAGFDGQAGFRFRGGDEVQNGFVVHQRLRSPVFADEGEHSVFDRIPFGGTRGIMTDLDPDAETVAEGVLELVLPQPGAIPVTASTVGCN
jgi:hypothetical protein